MKNKYEPLRYLLDERGRRLWSAGEAKEIGWGGISLVAKATGLSRSTIMTGIKEINTISEGKTIGLDPGRVRRTGGGRKSLEDKDSTLLEDLEKLLEPVTRGDPECTLRWSCKSTGKLAAELNRQGHQISARKVSQLLHRLGYSLQSNRKTKEGGLHSDRNAQFEYINNQTQLFQSGGAPAISVDTKKKELIGDFKNGGREWCRKCNPEQVRVYDFPNIIEKESGHYKGIPYGVYDVTANQGWVSVGNDHDTAEFACEAIRRWWFKMGRSEYKDATELLIMADGGGSNGVRSRLWKACLQELANKTGLQISVCHFPPGTSKWNKIEHRMFCHITQNWCGKPLVSHETMVSLIGSTTTRKGLKIRAELDDNQYEIGIKVPDEELANINIKKAIP
ncbi:MAG: ISAzo13 family transposase [bacterium]|nr:ISAzo13 family transposase [bacterium]